MMPAADHDEASFTLTKWYLDCVSDDGRVMIGYWASLAWHRLSVSWHSIVLFGAGQRPVRRSSLRLTPPPSLEGTRLTWQAPALGCVVEAEARKEPIKAKLLSADAGIVEWCAEVPAALLSVQIGGSAPLHGPGYAERILLTLPPWRLPIRELRWGRWHDAQANRSLVWIDWRGASPRNWVFVDGILASAAAVSDDSVCAGDTRLEVGKRRTLETRSFSQIARSIAPLRGIVPGSLLAFRQTRWCSDAMLSEASGVAQSGQAIHEVVVFR